MPAVYSTNGMETLIHLLQMYRDKKSPIFIETCMLLSLLLQDPHIRMVCVCELSFLKGVFKNTL